MSNELLALAACVRGLPRRRLALAARGSAVARALLGLGGVAILALVACALPGGDARGPDAVGN